MVCDELRIEPIVGVALYQGTNIPVCRLKSCPAQCPRAVPFQCVSTGWNDNIQYILTLPNGTDSSRGLWMDAGFDGMFSVPVRGIVVVTQIVH